MKVLVTGGAGYIGSHTVLELLLCGHEVVVIDNLTNSSSESLKRVAEIAGKKAEFYNSDVRDEAVLSEIFAAGDIDAVIHFAGLKSVDESVRIPLYYYQNNLDSTMALLKQMQEHNVKKLVFSSSATVYGDPTRLPITEDMPLSATNPYGQTKLIIEQILSDMAATNNGWNITSLRYFNPVGAHESGRIGEDPTGPPNNLLPYASQVAVGKRSSLKVFGDDYDTIDGTGVRDYIHVVDLAKAHLAALENLDHEDVYKAYNIGTGVGVSVLELIASLAKASKKEIPYEVVGRRSGDVASCYADVDLAKKELGWNAALDIDQACADSWRWQSSNPDGYKKIGK
jgi:UDP-glucose 4-epimerase